MSKTNITIECKQPVDDLQFSCPDFTEFLKTNIKVYRKRGNLANKLTIEHNKDANTIVFNSTEVVIPRHYVRYLTKKYLAKANDGSLRGSIRMTVNRKNNFQLHVNAMNEEEE